jgi:hypothetical protein
VEEKQCHWNVEVVAIAMGMMTDAGMMGDDGQRCSAPTFGATTILARMSKKKKYHPTQ